MSIPHLRHSENGIHLIVKDKPVLILPGELHNSSLSSTRYMSTGQFDFTELDKVILDARNHGIYLVLLWFGSYKNGISTYVPHWVKRDVERFPRVHVWDPEKGGKRTIEMISPLCEEGWKADARAFERLMKHIKEVDEEHSTVVMVQVQNETGLLGDSRDRSVRAEEVFQAGVPTHLLDHLLSSKSLHPRFTERYGERLPGHISGGLYTWESVFGPGTAPDEAFMVYYISRYVGHVTEAEKRAYGIPLYTNTWLNFDTPSALNLDGYPIVVGGGARPGIYPSGGPCPHVSDIWRFNAPALDFLAPDLYFHDYELVCQNCIFPSTNPLFIPEQRRDEHGARRVWLAYATYGALGTSPFDVDTEATIVGREYKLLEQTSQFLLNAKPSQRMGFFFEEIPETGDRKGKETWTRAFGNLEVTIERAFVFGKPGPGGGMIIQLGDENSYCFLVVGRGFHVRFRGLDENITFTGILGAWEKEVDDVTGELSTLRTLNGDETRSGEFLIMPNDDPDYGGFPIAVTIPARTCIAEVEAYTIFEKVL
ncbi:glycoside hydrolase superfamily [Aspergillus venezuelensis]